MRIKLLLFFEALLEKLPSKVNGLQVFLYFFNIFRSLNLDNIEGPCSIHHFTKLKVQSQFPAWRKEAALKCMHQTTAVFFEALLKTITLENE